MLRNNFLMCYLRWVMLARRMEGHTLQSPILNVIVVVTSLFGRRTGSRVKSHTLLTKAVNRVTSERTPHRIPSHDIAVLLRV